ncbi:hypothetical protein M2451_002804 [Dysgonomonas sp. PFB1-18]|uniref:PCMD domain-containing protein n=1 Tax=unclassified Dysgonomonas TaxID=2630389 RepID=UPI002473EEFE|nr:MULTISPECIES: PCMD domain-containing protein [unclassified Dysgonomonas]MDH6309310.1 hypothetical protein [Dysgonomonas sp. PF1-14]MDH6339825.1 hypothetical protein [Dysgonomonas sp. PF1-16]MDH6381473.1 hypothetical protein [Dysgonomonas sp. PFB1-18]MDH6398688.1 hypothetical protein [Dysgonomonas sp. PF1-23]
MNKKIFYLVLSIMSLGFFTACDDKPLNSEAEMKFIAFDTPSVIGLPKMEGTNVTFYVAYSTTDEELKEMVPTIILSTGATVSPESGSKVDFTGGTVKFTVTSQDWMHSTEYNVTYKRAANPDAEILGMSFSDEVVVTQPEIDGTDITFYVDFYATDEQLKELTPDITVSPQATVTPASGSKVDFSGGAVKFTVNAGDGKGKTEYNVICKKAPSPETSISSFSVSGAAVVIDAVMDGSNIYFYVDPNATAAQLKDIIPIITLSENATVSPASGTKVDFSGGTVKFTVTAEDGVTKTEYDVTARKATIAKYGFENWSLSGDSQALKYQITEGWASSNDAVKLIKLLSGMTGYTGGYPINPTEDKRSGNYAAEIYSLDTKGKMLFGNQIPKVTAGTMFLGSFITNSTDHLASTKFGILFDKKPLKVRGYYKYKAGTEFYNNLELDTTGKKDGMSVSAVLYEVENDTDILTGHDIYTSEKIVAKAIMTNDEEKNEFSPFEITLDYSGKTYDSSKKYKFTVIFSSSKDGIKYDGAIGSRLVIDDVEIISE